MAAIKYKIVKQYNNGTQEAPEIYNVLSEVILPYSEANIEKAKREAMGDNYELDETIVEVVPRTVNEKLDELKKAFDLFKALVEKFLGVK